MPVTSLVKTTIKPLQRVRSDKSGIVQYSLQAISGTKLPRSEFNSRFPTLLEMDKVTRFDTYHRSAKKRLQGVKQKDFTFQGNQDEVKARMYPKTGNFYNPFHFSAYKDSLGQRELRELDGDGDLYDELLEYQKSLAKHVVEGVKDKNKKVKINSDYEYSCVLFSLPKPTNEKNPSTWTQFYSAYYIAIVNKLALERGINIELHRRASFGCFRPSVAECRESLRISVGLAPKAYAQCLIDGIDYLQKLFSNESVFAAKPVSKRLENDLKKYNTKRSCSVELKESWWETLWASGDKSNKSFASQIFRAPKTVEYFIDLIFDECQKSTLDELFESEDKLKQCFLTPLVTLFKSYKLVGQTLSFKVTQPLKKYTWFHESEIDDETYWKLVQKVCLAWGATKTEIGHILKAKKTTHLHCFMEHLSTEFNFNQMAFNGVYDGNGSDSETEETLDIEEKHETVHAKKLITATGMRSIQLAYSASKLYLNEQYQVDPDSVSFEASEMYYETDEALSSHSIPTIELVKSTKSKIYNRITLFDLNHCNKDQSRKKNLFAKVRMTDKLAIVDTTSATSTEMNVAIKKLWAEKPGLELIIFASSGLKNEQAMSDTNPYGTVRIFGKSQELVDNFLNYLIDLEKKADYKHPKESHLIRKSAKEAGMTPTNRSILSVT